MTNVIDRLLAWQSAAPGRKFVIQRFGKEILELKLIERQPVEQVDYILLPVAEVKSATFDILSECADKLIRQMEWRASHPDGVMMQ